METALSPVHSDTVVSHNYIKTKIVLGETCTVFILQLIIKQTDQPPPLSSREGTVMVKQRLTNERCLWKNCSASGRVEARNNGVSTVQDAGTAMLTGDSFQFSICQPFFCSQK